MGENTPIRAVELTHYGLSIVVRDLCETCFVFWPLFSCTFVECEYALDSPYSPYTMRGARVVCSDPRFAHWLRVQARAHHVYRVHRHDRCDAGAQRAAGVREDSGNERASFGGLFKAGVDAELGGGGDHRAQHVGRGADPQTTRTLHCDDPREQTACRAVGARAARV